MKQLLLTVLFLLCCLSLPAQQAHLDSLYAELDRSIEHADDYMAVRQQRINGLYQQLKKSSSAARRYQLSMQLFDEYQSFQNDSAIYYLAQSIQLARQMGHQADANMNLALQAYQCSKTGLYAESCDIFREIDVSALTDQGHRAYLIAGQHLYSELAYYSKIPRLKRMYSSKAQYFSNLIFRLLKPQDPACLERLLMHYYSRGQYNEALGVSNRWMRQVRQGTHGYAIATFYRFLIYSAMGNKPQACQWLALSADTDIRLAVTDQGSLWELANRLASDADQLPRAYRYIRYAWRAAQKFNTKVRSSQISPVLSHIDESYQAHVAKVNMRLKISIALSVSLLLAVLLLLVYVNSQRKKLAKARNELDQSNRILTELNQQLSDSNRQLQQLNRQISLNVKKLNESNKMKEEYIGRFLRLCSVFIDKSESLKKRISKRIKNKEYGELQKLLEVKESDWDELYQNFDLAFLNLFPDFVESLNALLRPTDQLSVRENGCLSTPIRIFALIRLGFDDSSKIAEFLHYSVNTIYNYRAKIKNGAVGNRDDFEQKVKAIGMK